MTTSLLGLVRTVAHKSALKELNPMVKSHQRGLYSPVEGAIKCQHTGGHTTAHGVPCTKGMHACMRICGHLCMHAVACVVSTHAFACREHPTELRHGPRPTSSAHLGLFGEGFAEAHAACAEKGIDGKHGASTPLAGGRLPTLGPMS